MKGATCVYTVRSRNADILSKDEKYEDTTPKLLFFWSKTENVYRQT